VQPDASHVRGFERQQGEEAQATESLAKKFRL